MVSSLSIERATCKFMESLGQLSSCPGGNFSGILHFFFLGHYFLCALAPANCSAWRSFLRRGGELRWALMWLHSPSMLIFLLAIRFAPGSIAISRSTDPIETSRIVGCMNRGIRLGNLLRRYFENFGSLPPFFSLLLAGCHPF